MFESVTRIEPCGFEERTPDHLRDLVAEIRAASAELGAELHPEVRRALRGAVRASNAYHSNLIERHFAPPLAVIEAMEHGASANPMAQEALAHMRAEAWIDQAIASDDLKPTAAEAIRAIHQQFYEGMPPEARNLALGDEQVEILPGAYRTHEVEVGRHQPPSAHRVADFMKHFELRYRGLTSGRLGEVLSIPAAHHRLAYIHPFADGNGRVGRLMSHAMIQKAGIGADGLWSLSRGLWRGLEGEGEYLRQMEAADHPRRGERDGRGNLSLAGLESFTRWFLTVMLREIRHAKQVFDADALAARCSALADGSLQTRALARRALAEGGLPGASASTPLKALGILVAGPDGNDFMKTRILASLWSGLIPGLFSPAPAQMTDVADATPSENRP